MKNHKSKLIGITLLFSYISQNKIEGEKRYYIFSYINFTDLIKKINKVANKRVKRYSQDDCIFHGVFDCFDIPGPLNEKAILGYEIWRSKKNEKTAKSLVKSSNTFVIKRFKKPTKTDYIVEAIYFIKEKNNDKKYTIKISFKFDGKESSKQLFKNLNSYLNSKICLNKINAFLKSNVINLNDVKFIGLSDILYSPEKIRIGGCFSSLYKSFERRSQIDKLKIKNTEIRKKLK